MTVKIYLDGGHGGNDSGAIGNGLQEKDLNLKIVQKIKNILENEYEGFELMLSRETDKTMSLTERTNKANKWGADYFISVHINAAENKAANGFESFIYNGNVSSKTRAFQNVLHRSIMTLANNVTDRGQKQANFFVLRESKMSAVLTEILFVSNKSDAEKLKSDSFLDRIARGHVIGLEQIAGIRKKEPPKQENNRLYRVQVGAFSDRKNSEALVKRLKEQGYTDAFIVD